MKLALLITIIGLIITIAKHMVNKGSGSICFAPTREATTILKGGMSLVIVWVHFSIFSPTPVSYSGYFAALGAPVVGMFLFLSGYGLMKSWQIHGVSFWNGFLKRRFSKLLCPLLVATLIFQIVQWTQGIFSWSLISKGFLQGDPPLPFSWFVYEIAVLYLLFFICGRWTHNYSRFCALLFLSILIIYVFLRHINWLYVWYCTLPCFMGGVLMGLFENRVLTILNRHFIAAMILFAVFCSLTLFSLVKSEGYEDPSNLLGGIFLFLLPFIWFVLLICIQLRTGWVGYALGVISYEIYVFHGIFIMNMALINGSGWFHFFFVSGGSLLSAFFMHKIQLFLHHIK